MSEDQGPLPPFTDLRAVAHELSNDERFTRLATSIEKASRAQSCAADLKLALTCIEALDKLRGSFRGHGTLTRGATESALMMQAVGLYTRATHLAGKGAERGSIAIRDKLTPEQQADHDAIVAVRNSAGAHVQVDKTIAGEVWNQSLLFAIKTDRGWLPANGARAVQFESSTYGRLIRQVPVALALITTRFQQHLSAVTDLLNSNPSTAMLLESHTFDPTDVFGNEVEVRRILSSHPGTSRSSVSDDPAQWP